MTANPPSVRIERVIAPPSDAISRTAKESPRPDELSDLEKLLFPRWMDHDFATGGPHYMGYVMCVITIGLFAMLAVLALFVVS